MKKFLLILAAMAVVGGQSSFAQTKVLKLSAETSKLNVAQVSEAEGDVQMSRYLFAGYNTLCLPISVSADQLKEQLPGVKLERLGAIRQEGSTLCLYLVDCTSEGVEAGMPYLVYSPQKKYLRVNSNGARRLAADASAVRMNDGQGNQVNFSGSWETRMDENGMIRYDGQQISTEQTEKVQTEFTSVALLGAVSCGVPTLEEEYAQEYVSLPVSMFGKGTFFLLKANGDSMIEAGISSGDLVLVRKQSEAKEGDIVVALVGNENTLKRYFVDKENEKIRLHPENKKMKDIIVSSCEIQGVAIKVIKNLE